MNPDQRAEDYNKGFEQGQLHNKPSPETQRRMDELKHEIEDLRKDLLQAEESKLEKLDLILAQTTKTNGRVSSLEMWKLKGEGGAMVLKGVWGFIAVYLVGASYGLFNMYVQFQTLDYKVTQMLNERL